MGLGVGARASCRHAPDWATPGIPQCQSRGRTGGWDWELEPELPVGMLRTGPSLASHSVKVGAGLEGGIRSWSQSFL